MSRDLRESARAEAFSDGVFAFAITLLVLNLKDPGHPLLDGLLAQGPSFFAFVASFATILVMWVNHHNMFNYIKRVNTTLLFLNGLLLFFIVLTAFTTQLVAINVKLVQTDDGRTAAALYSGNAVILGLAWSTLSYYCAKSGLGPAPGSRIRFFIGPTPYFVAFVLSFFSAALSMAAILVIAAFWTLSSRGFWGRGARLD